MALIDEKIASRATDRKVDNTRAFDSWQRMAPPLSRNQKWVRLSLKQTSTQIGVGHILAQRGASGDF